jgi:hypothetical protein
MRKFRNGPENSGIHLRSVRSLSDMTTGMTPNDMRERAKDCYQRSDRARQAAGLAKDSSREWLLRMSDQWADMGRQYEATAAQQTHWSLPN